MTVVSQSDRITDMRRRFDDVEDFICWGEIAEAYFDRSASWFYHKLNGHDGNGRPDGFTDRKPNNCAARSWTWPNGCAKRRSNSNSERVRCPYTLIPPRAFGREGELVCGEVGV